MMDPMDPSERSNRAKPKALDPFDGKLPTTQQAAEDLARLTKLAYEAHERSEVARREADHIQDDMSAAIGPLIDRGVLKVNATYRVEGGCLTVFGTKPHVQVFFTKLG